MVPIYLPIYSNLFYVYPYVIAGAGIGMGGKEAETNTEIWKNMEGLGWRMVGEQGEIHKQLASGHHG